MIYLGAVAFWLGSIACLPPTWRVIRRRSAVDYSWWGLVMSLAAMSCMLPYLWHLHATLSFIAQAVGYLACLAITTVKATAHHAQEEKAVTEDVPRGFTKDGYHRDRWWYQYPWKWTRPWLPRYGWGSDEYCNPTIYLIGPLIGGVVIRYKRGLIRTDDDGRCAICQAFENEPRPYKTWDELMADTVRQLPYARPLKVTVWPEGHPGARTRDIQIHGVGWTMTWRKRFKEWDKPHAEYMVRDYLRCRYGDSLRGMAVLRLVIEWKDSLDVVPAEP